MALTQYGVTSTALTATTFTGPASTHYTITGYTYTNPNIAFTTSTAHTFAVGDRVEIIGIVTNGTTRVSGTSYSVTAVTSTTFTVNFGATAPGAYTSGGVAFIQQYDNQTGGKYIPASGAYVFMFGNGGYMYSFNATSWSFGHLPNSQNRMSGIDFDGTTYVACDTNGGLWSSTTLADGSWTSRYTSSYTFNGIRWCGGSSNRWVAFGVSNAVNTAPGTGGNVVTSTSATSGWANQAISGTASVTGYQSSDFDGVSTIVISSSSHGVISTNGGSTWTGYANSVIFNANSTAGSLELESIGSYPIIRYNPTAGKWCAFASGSGNNTGSSTTGTVTSAWQKNILQNFPKGAYYVSSTLGLNFQDIQNNITFDSANQRFYCWDASGSAFNIYTYSSTPTSLSSVTEQYPLLSIASTPNIMSSIWQNAAAGTGGKLIAAVWGNNKWVFLSSVISTSVSWGGNYTISVLQ